jgi:mRNA-degrading endonuclease RelE of RelBE toxin-antitoxin system
MRKLIKDRINESLAFNIIESLIDEDYPTNWNFDEFKALTSFNKRALYCNNNLQRISSGSARIVYKIDNDKVLKLAKNAKGLDQNEM